MTEGRRPIRRWVGSGILVALVAAIFTTVAPGSAGAGPVEEFEVTKEYVETFYPLFLSHQQFTVAPFNKIFGPDKISPIYKAVVAINDDTLYANAFLDLSSEPVILTVPATTGSYSSLVLDGLGQVYDVGLPSQSGGTVVGAQLYALTGPDYSGTPVLPGGATQIAMPENVMLLIFRADRYSSTGENTEAVAEAFRTSLLLQTVTDYDLDPTAGATAIKPEIDFGFPFKTEADDLARLLPITFLTGLQNAVASSVTPTLTPEEQVLSGAFDVLFAARTDDAAFEAGVRAGHQAIIDNYLGNAGPTGWSHFTNVGKWGSAVLDRASLNEYIQYGNSIETAAYYHTFVDVDGNDLVGSTPTGYVLTFPADQIPPAGRFWSVTAYTPDAIEMIENDLNKYLVASYTPGLEYNADGSVSIYVSQQQPTGVPQANWLPVSSDQFNLMLRIYGVIEGSSVANNTYVPPAVTVYTPASPVPTPISLVPRFTG